MSRRKQDSSWEVILKAVPLTPYTWHLLAGLMTLRDQGVIHLKYEPGRIATPRPAQFGELAVTDKEVGRTYRVHIDLADGPDVGYLRSLSEVDVVFKRSFQLANSNSNRSKIVVLPYGLVFPCRSGDEGFSFRYLFRSVQGLMPPYSSRAAKLIAWNVRTIARLLAEPLWSSMHLPPLLSSFEVPPSIRAEELVFFQTRLWDKSGAREHEENEQRAEVVSGLRQAFGERFVGGLIGSSETLARYPGCSSTLPADQKSYLELLRRCSVVVSTTGLHGSLPFKLPEYLAASRVVVMESQDTLLPVPLNSGEHVLVFTSVEDCVAQCDAALSDPAKRQDMRDNAWSYYCNEVRPDALLRNRLNDLRDVPFQTH